MTFRAAVFFWRNLKLTLLEHKLSLWVTAVTFSSSVLLLLCEGGVKSLVLVPLAIGSVASSFVLIVSLLKGIECFFLMLFRYKPESPIRFLIERTKDFIRSGEAFYSTLAIGLLFSFFAASFSINKALIPRLNPFSWDAYFTTLDYKLHLFAYPHEYLQWIVSNSFLLLFIDLTYQSWFYFYYFSIFCAAYCFRDRPEAKVYILASCLTWFIGGNILALIFSSAGPIYEEYVGKNAHYAAQLELIRASERFVPNLAMIVRDELWTSLKKQRLFKHLGLSQHACGKHGSYGNCFLLHAQSSSF